MIKTMIVPCIATIFNLMYDRFVHKIKRNPVFYVIYFSLLFILCYFYPARCQEFSEKEIDVFIESLQSECGLSQYNRDRYFRACNQFALEGMIHLQKADDIILLYPRSTKRDQAHRAIEGAVGSIAVKNVKAKVVTVLLVMLAGYLQDVYDNWNDIEYHIKESERMFSLHDYYQDKLFRNEE